MAAAAIVLGLGAWLCAGTAWAAGSSAPGDTLSADTFAWAPAGDAAVARGREVARRFDQTSLWEISVDVNDAFSAENRRAMAIAEEELRRVPGVRRVVGPAGLLDVTADAGGKVAVRTILDRDRGGGEGEGQGEGEGERNDEAVRDRIARRADALGWFLAADGSNVRFLIDSDRPASLRPGLEQAIASSGLQLLHAGGAHLAGQALWPDPADRRTVWLPAVLSAAWVLGLLLTGRRIAGAVGVLPRARRPLVVAAASVGAAGFFVLSAVPAMRGLGLRAAVAAGLAAAAALLLERVRPLGRALAPRGARPPIGLGLGAALLVVLALLLGPVLRVRTQQWRATPLMFVDVRGDLDQPVVLREVQRLTDYLRAQPGVAGAWSVADLFFGVSFTGDDVSRIPDSSELVRRILFQARADPALSLELAPDHHEGLVAIRFDDEAGVSRLDLFDRLALYLRTELRVALLQVDLTAPGLSPVTRSLGKGVLATDARERIVRICERSGRALSDGEVASVEMLARRTAVVPTVDLGRLRREVAAELRDQRIAIARRAGLADELATLGEDATPEDVRRALAARLGPRVRDPELIRKAASLHDWLAVARVRNSARVNFREMLYGADLPSEGLLADEVRAATRDAMGPMAGIPVRAETPGAYHLDAMSVGGAANDQALSVFLPPGIRWGGVLATGIVALLLVASGRGRGLLWLPVGLGPVAVAVIVLSLTRDPVGMAFVSFIAGALSGGVAWVASLAARRAP